MTTAAEALHRWRAEHSLPGDTAAGKPWRPLSGLKLRLPGFRWRADAIDRHDLHHVLTETPCTLIGECRIAAWEFGAGPYPAFAARAFCLPLVLFGAARAPQATWASFRKGRGQRSLYSLTLNPGTTLAELEAHVAKGPRAHRLSDDMARFAALLALAALLTLAPIGVFLIPWL